MFVVQHAYERDESAEVKFIGVYSSQENAERAVERMKKLEGFCDHPDDFHIDRHGLDEDHWTSGFVTIRRGAE